MRTRKSTVSFQRPFTLKRDVGELPAGSYDIEIDEDEIQVTDRTAYRRVAIYFYAQNSASTRTIVVSPTDLESALERDLKPELGASTPRDVKSGDCHGSQTNNDAGFLATFQSTRPCTPSNLREFDDCQIVQRRAPKRGSDRRLRSQSGRSKVELTR